MLPMVSISVGCVWMVKTKARFPSFPKEEGPKGGGTVPLILTISLWMLNHDGAAPFGGHNLFGDKM